jgi:hypothetical protein
MTWSGPVHRDVRNRHATFTDRRRAHRRAFPRAVGPTGNDLAPAAEAGQQRGLVVGVRSDVDGRREQA